MPIGPARTAALLAGLIFALVGAAMPGPAAATAQEIAPTNPDTGAGGVRYFAETGHNLRDPFRSRWEIAGGAETVGLPLSEERYVEGSGGVLQTFEGITLLLDPTQQAPWDIRGQPLEREVREDAAPASARRAVSGCASGDCQFFPDTGHTVSGAIAAYWSVSGDVPLFGLPVSEPFDAEDEDGNAVTVQVFERAVLEADGDGVRLRPLVALATAEGGAYDDPAFRPAPPSGGTTSLINAEDGLRLRSAPSMDAEVIAVLPDKAEFIAPPGDHGSWVPGYVDGFAGWVSAEYLDAAPPLPTLAVQDWTTEVWQGAALGETNVRAQPTTKARVVEELQYGNPLQVTAWVEGEEVFEGADLWAQVGPNQYVYARNVGRTAPVLPPPVPADAPVQGRWIDVDLTQQVMVAYDSRTPVRVVETTTGMAGWETPPGFYFINNRVGNETMTSGAIGAEHFYELRDVLFTQYFTDRGHAIHFAWWRTEETIGRPGSHGCLNLLLDDARFFWDWAGIGTPVYVHP